MKHFFFLLFLCLTLHSFAQVPTFTGVTYYPGTNSNYINDIVVDANGNRYATGMFYGQLTLGADVYNTGSLASSFVMKTDSDGVVIWSVVLQAVFSSKSNAISLDNAGNIVIGGYFWNGMTVNGTLYNTIGKQDIFLMKFDPTGNVIWFRQMAGPVVQPEAYSTALNELILDDAGNIYFTGFFTDSIIFQSVALKATGLNDIVLGKVDSNGNLVWMQKAGGTYSGHCGLPNNDDGSDIAIDSHGNVYITGHYAFNATFGASGYVSSFHDVDIYLAKYDNDGNFLWVESEGGWSWEMSNAVNVDKNDNVYIGGQFQLTCIFGSDTLTSQSSTGSQYDVFLVKYNPDGVIQWVVQEGGLLSEYAYDLEVDDANNLYLGGEYLDGASFGDSLDLQCWSAYDNRTFVAKYDQSGNFKYMVHGGGYRNFPYAMCLDAKNDIVIGGNTSAISAVPIQFGPFINSGPPTQLLYIVSIDDPFNTVGTEDAVADMRAIVYPNPFSESAILEFENEFGVPFSLEILGLDGRVIHRQENIRANRIELSGADLAPGAYVYRLISPAGLACAGMLLIQ